MSSSAIEPRSGSDSGQGLQQRSSTFKNNKKPTKQDNYRGDYSNASESSPLLRHSSDDSQHAELTVDPYNVNRGSWRRTAGILLILSVSYLVFGSIVTYKRLSLPAAKSVQEATGPFDFSATSAWEHLGHIAQKPHPLNSRANLEVHDYLIQAVKDLQAAAKEKGRFVELAEDNVHLTLSSNYLGAPDRVEFYESSNVIVRVPGTLGRSEANATGNPEAVVVSAHFDSVLTGHGATDDGIGVTVCLEIIRNLINHPVKHNVIFNINNGEEVGLYGAAAFMKHPWADDVKAFVNLEGAGAGGRALLFRASNEALAGFYSKVGNSPHANVMGNDIFKMGLIKSSTDFTVYSEAPYSLPGLDIAFYSKRAFYHTLHDDMEHTSPNSIQHMGNTALAAIRGIADSNYLVKPKGIVSAEASIYYDVAGLFMLVYSFQTYMTLNYNLLVVVPVFVIWAIVNAQKNGLSVGAVLRSYVAMVVSCVAAVLTSVFFSYFITKVNPMLVYGEHWIGFLFCAFQCCTTIICVQWLWLVIEAKLRGPMGPLEVALQRAKLDSEQVANFGMLLFWWTALIGATVLGRKSQIGLFYFVSWFVACGLLSAFLSVLPRRRGTFWTLTRLWLQAIPLIMIVDIANTNMVAMSQTIVDGTPSMAVLTLFSLCALFCVMPMIPTMHRSSNFKGLSKVTVLITLALLVSACVVFPYSANDAPNKIFWRQTWDMDRQSSVVVAKTMHDLERVIDLVPSAKVRLCGPDTAPKSNLQQCVYEGAQPRIVTESRKSGKDIIHSKVAKPTYEKLADSGIAQTGKAAGLGLIRSVNVTWTVQESRLCRVQFGSEVPIVSINLEDFDGSLRGSAIVGAEEEPGSDLNGMIAFRRLFDRPWNLNVQYKVKDESAPQMPMVLACLYDEWEQGQIPAFSEMKDSLPTWALLGGGKGPGLLSVQKSIDV